MIKQQYNVIVGDEMHAFDDSRKAYNFATRKVETLTAYMPSTYEFEKVAKPELEDDVFKWVKYTSVRRFKMEGKITIYVCEV